jgi:integrase
VPYPRLQPGAHGDVRCVRDDTGWVATCRVRDADGRRRTVQRRGPSKRAATQALLAAVAERPGFGRQELTADSSLNEVADRWLQVVQDQVEASDRAPNTVRVYRSTLDNHIRPALGELRIREVTVTRCDDFLRALRTRHQVSLVRTTRTVLNGVLGYAVRRELIRANPMRDVSRITGQATKQPRALTELERTRWLQAMEDDPVAVRHDLPDLTRFLLATGCRIGEALALDWSAVDLDAKTVSIDWTIVRLERGGGLVRTPTKTLAGRRTLPLPGWAVDMLAQRPERGRVVFPDSKGGWRDPSNTSRSLREARERAGFGWVTSHVFRKSVATTLHDSGLSPREIADQLGHANLRTLEVYIGRRAPGRAAAAALEIGWDDE